MWCAAAELIRRSTTPPEEYARMQPLGRDFFKRYLRANPHVKKVRQKPQEPERLGAQQRDILQKHFSDLAAIIANKNIQSSDIWNFDEVGFRIGIGGAQDVVTLQAYKVAESPSETNRDFITIGEAINAAGDTIPPLYPKRNSNPTPSCFYGAQPRPINASRYIRIRLLQ